MTNDHDKKFLCLTKAILFLSLVSFAAFYSASFYYRPLGTDGGWYSYPALSLSQGGDPAENMAPVDATGSQALNRCSGIRARFPFLTYKSLRVSYTAFWFKYFSPGIVSLKMLALIELVILISLFYYLLRSYVNDPAVIVLIFSFFLLDKSILLIAASDYRPDIAIAALSIVIYLVIKKPPSYGSVFFVTALMTTAVLIHVTAVIPITFFLSYHFFRHAIKKEYNLKFFLSLAVYLAASVITILFYDKITSFVFPTRIVNEGSLSFVVERVGKRIFQGFSFLFYKEFLRWKDYFLLSNIASLLLIMVTLSSYAAMKLKHRLFNTENDAIFLSISLTAISIVVVDPHLTETHVIPLIPFIMLFLAKELELNGFKRNKIKHVVAFLALINIGITGVISYKTYSTGNDSALDIRSIRAGINTLITQKENRSDAWSIGPVELWPYFSVHDNIILFDNSRNVDEIGSVSKYVGKLDYLIINKEYREYGWMDGFRREYPEVRIREVGVIGNGPDRIEVYSIHVAS